MDLNTKDIQLQYDGFLNTPFLWNSDAVFQLQQIELPKKKLPTFNSYIAKNLRLGKRVERFISHELQHNSSIKILAENIQIQNGKTTVGEIDFIIQQNNTPIHLEVMFKFYLYDATVGETELEHWIGPNRKDSLVEKLTKLKEKQFPLLYHNCAKSKFDTIEIDEVSQALCLLVSLFIPYEYKASFSPIYQKYIKGFYLNFEKFTSLDNAEKAYYLPSKKEWGMDPSENEIWKDLNGVEKYINTCLKEKQSPLCWQKYKDSYVAFFIVWW